MTSYHTKIKDDNLKRKVLKKIRKSPKKSRQHYLEKFFNALRQRYQQKCLFLQNVQETSYWNLLHFISITLLCILMSSPLILVPQHNAIKNSEYWYEVIIAVQFSFTLVYTLYIMMECNILFNANHFMSIRTFVLMYCSLMMSQIVIILMPYYRFND